MPSPCRLFELMATVISELLFYGKLGQCEMDSLSMVEALLIVQGSGALLTWVDDEKAERPKNKLNDMKFKKVTTATRYDEHHSLPLKLARAENFYMMRNA